MTNFELGSDGPRLILVGLDGSRTAYRATAYAAGLARRQGSELVILHVETTGVSSAAAAARAESERQLSESLRAEVEQRAGDFDVPVRFVVACGDPYAAITKLAGELRADAVVVGASESRGHRVVGSLATRLVRAGKWPVTVVP